MLPQCRIISAANMPQAYWHTWRQWHTQDVRWQSPYFDPHFISALMAVGRVIEIAVFYQGKSPVAFFAFERKKCKSAHPAGWPMADFQAIISAPNTEVDILAFMRIACLKSVVFDHFYQHPKSLVPYINHKSSSPYLEISGNIAGYKSRLFDSTAKDTLNDGLRCARKAAKDLGPLRFEFKSQDPSVLDWLIDNKRRKYQKTGAEDFFANAENRQFFKNLMLTQHDNFYGALSALWAGDTLIAAHIGMVSNGVLHWWFPTYDESYAAYSPGRVLMLQVVERADALGLHKIDLGKGDAAYKRRIMTGETWLAEGEIETRSLVRAYKQAQVKVQRRLKKTGLYQGLRALKAQLTGRKSG